MATARSITLSSVGTATLNSDYMGNWAYSVVSYFGSSISSAFYFVQATVDDIMTTSSQNWFTISSATLSASSNFDNTPYYIPVVTPIAAVRLNSTNNNASITLKLLQRGG